MDKLRIKTETWEHNGTEQRKIKNKEAKTCGSIKKLLKKEYAKQHIYEQ